MHETSLHPLAVLPDRAQAGVPEAFVEGGDVLGQQLRAAGFQGGPLGVQFFQAIHRGLVDAGDIAFGLVD